jgi:hypothetical protein
MSDTMYISEGLFSIARGFATIQSVARAIAPSNCASKSARDFPLNEKLLFATMSSNAIASIAKALPTQCHGLSLRLPVDD